MGLRPIVIIGAGGHARVCVDTVEAMGESILGIIDREPPSPLSWAAQYPYLGSDGVFLASYTPEKCQLVNGIGTLGDNQGRKKLNDQFSVRGFEFFTLIHPSAIVSRFVKLSPGAQIMAGAVLQPGVKVGYNTILNTRCSLDHDCEIGDNCHIAPGVTLSGSVTIGNDVHVGTGATIIQGLKVAQRAFIGAGAVVLKDVGVGQRVYPARNHVIEGAKHE